MNASELARLIGREGNLLGPRGDARFPGLMVTVQVVDARTSYGKVQYLVTPVAGGGKAWVEDRRVEFEEETGR